MDCCRIEREGLTERYLAGKLTKDEQRAFESHCFSCPKCLEKLQLCRLLQEELEELEVAGLSIVTKESRSPIRRWAWVSAAALVLAAVAIGIGWQLGILGGRSAGSDKISVLSKFEPPLYIPPSLRGAVDEASERLRAGMMRYQLGDYAGAIPILRSAAERNPRGAPIRFFLGICYLLSGQTDEGCRELKITIELGDSAYLEEAHFYLAKGLLRQGHIRPARLELKAVVELGGRFEKEAARLLTELK